MNKTKYDTTLKKEDVESGVGYLYYSSKEAQTEVIIPQMDEVGLLIGEKKKLFFCVKESFGNNSTNILVKYSREQVQFSLNLSKI